MNIPVVPCRGVADLMVCTSGEAKEGVEIQNENQTLASITFQNYFRLARKLAGMTAVGGY